MFDLDVVDCPRHPSLTFVLLFLLRSGLLTVVGGRGEVSCRLSWCVLAFLCFQFCPLSIYFLVGLLVGP